MCQYLQKYIPERCSECHALMWIQRSWNFANGCRNVILTVIGPKSVDTVAISLTWFILSWSKHAGHFVSWGFGENLQPIQQRHDHVHAEELWGPVLDSKQAQIFWDVESVHTFQKFCKKQMIVLHCSTNPLPWQPSERLRRSTGKYGGQCWCCFGLSCKTPQVQQRDSEVSKLGE